MDSVIRSVWDGEYVRNISRLLHPNIHDDQDCIGYQLDRICTDILPLRELLADWSPL
jgi:hypothetical protein